MAGIEGQMEGITRESTSLLEKTNGLAEDIQEKSQQLNSVVTAAKGFADSVSNLSDSVKHVTSSINTNVVKNSDQIAKVIQWSNAFMGIRDKLKDQKDSQVETIYEDVPRKRKRK